MSAEQDQRYRAAAEEFGAALQRLARATEANPERARDLLQDMHVALWRSFAGFDGRCALRTWVYRVAHNVAATHIDSERRNREALVSLDEAGDPPAPIDPGRDVEDGEALKRLNEMIRALEPPDRQIIALYLEGLSAASIAEITGLSGGAIATRISRVKAHFAKIFKEGAYV
jgi:RNA polymerase sigma-70 factor (ECF subfamily)